MDMYLSREKTIRDFVKLAKPLVDTLSSMQADCEKQYSSKKAFCGVESLSQTSKCYQSTILSWEAVVKRLDHFDTFLADKVNPHALCNESIMVNSFGFTVQKSQGQLQTE